ncbi:isocitrate/isopropylmalate dehydrogenase family protein [Escherichia coli 3-073-06_S3_C1]|nr:isocitrate/isopropylmalate dehydrogenase family protein [Escherichia coli 3-073-06_S3_C1]KDZ57320.1 isocitrate/isopropylmalate dehydrogenase family protein [Escherichia coli 3-073-06_S3_C2]
MMKTMRIAAIPGDGIGKEVLPEGIRVLQAAAERWGFALSFEQMEWASCEYYSHHGKMMPDDWHEQLREGANKQVISSQADSLIKISRIWADFFPANTSNQPI